MGRNILLLMLGLFLMGSRVNAQTSCSDLNGFVNYKDTGATGSFTLTAGSVEKAAQTYYYSGPGKISSVRIYGIGFAGVALTVGIYNVDNTRRPTSLIQSTNTIWWWWYNRAGYIDVYFPEGGVAVSNNFAVEVELRNAYPFGSSFQLRYTGNGEGRGEDLASLAGTLTGGNWTSAMTDFNKDGDFYLVPDMTNFITSDFTASANCIGTGGTVNFSNSTQMTRDSMFNLIGWHAAPSFHYYEWNFGDGSAVSNVVNPSHAFNTPGVYTVSLKSTIVGWSDTCYDIKKMQISVGLNVSADSLVNVTCNGLPDGSVVAAGSGGAGQYIYCLGGEVYFPITHFINLGAGTFTLHVIDSLGCSATTEFTINQPPAISFSVSMVTNASCGNSDGGILATAIGGAGFFEYKLGLGNYQSSGTFANLSAGSYNVTAQDTNGCTASEEIAINNAGGPGLNLISATQVSCNGLSNGSIIVLGTGGSGTLQYSIDGGANYQASGRFDNLVAGDYSVMVKDADGCSQYVEVTIIQPEALFLTAAEQMVSCYGGSNGQINVSSASGGTGVFSYSINELNYQSNTGFTGLTAGSYRVYVKDAAGCTQSTVVIVGQPTAVTATVAVVNNTCYAGSDGALNVSATGGTAGYTFSINGEDYQPNGNFSNLGAANYTITVMDANNCSVTASGIVNQPTEVTASINTTSATCGNSNGGILAIASGGSGTGYLYAISDSNYNTTGLFSGLSAQTYYMIVADGAGCGNFIQVNIADANGPSITSTSHTSISCSGGEDGTITINTVTGGTGVLQYSINGTNWQNSAQFNFLGAGVFVVTVKDANGCTGTVTDTLAQPNPFSMSTTVTDLTCYENNSGKVVVLASGGAGVLAYSIDAGVTFQASNVFTGLGVGSNVVLVRDAAGCTGYTTFVLTQPGQLLLNSGVLNVTCNGADNGTIILTASGGTGDYTYSLNNGGFYGSSIFMNLSGADYTVSVRDANGCVTTIQVPVYEPNPLLTNPDISNVSCAGGDNGIIAVNVTGGTAPYAYAWSNGSTQQNQFNLIAGTYSVTVKDGQGCGDTSVFYILQPATPLVVNGVVTNATTAASNDGSVGLTITGGMGPYTFIWSDNATTQDISGLAMGNYSVNVKDANGCIVSGIFYVSSGTGIAQVAGAANELSIYPNPSSNTTTVEVKGGDITNLKVTDLLGQIVFASEPKQPKVELNCSTYASGVYIVEAEVNGVVISKRLVISK